MKEYKNIDRVFQENLKDLEIDPGYKVWRNIENELQAKQPDKVMPLWRKISGVAILFLLMFSVGFGFFKLNKRSTLKNNTITKPTSENTVVNNTPVRNLNQINDPNSNGNIALKEKGSEDQSKSTKNIYSAKAKISDNIHNDLAFESNDDKVINNKIDQSEENIFLSHLTNEQDDVLIVQSKPKQDKSKKWSVGPTIAPVYFNTAHSGSPISDNLANNSKTTDEALSVGVKVNYQITKKLNVQSGLNKVELAYNTKNVNAFISSSKAPNHNLQTKSNVLLVPSNSGIDVQASAGVQSKSNVTGELNQSFEYLEIPLEMKYNLYQNKVGLNLVGGFSTFILTNNQVSFISPSSTTTLGEANNLNNINFSGNFGLDLDYRISKDWFVNVSPMVKYQFNTFSSSSGNFQPYYFGVYSGINYRF